MSLPAYAEQMQRWLARDGEPWECALTPSELRRILRDAEIAQAVRKHVLAKLPPAVRDILTKETP